MSNARGTKHTSVTSELNLHLAWAVANRIIVSNVLTVIGNVFWSSFDLKLAYELLINDVAYNFIINYR